jgi:small neutral amino acid transporter SnatA (MarC family)
MGYAGIRVITRLSGLLLSVIAVQFVVNGLQQLRLTG